MHIHFHFHAAYFVDYNSVSVDTSVMSFEADEENMEQIRRTFHDEHREIMWEDGKGISVECDDNKALARFTETCENFASPF